MRSRLGYRLALILLSKCYATFEMNSPLCAVGATEGKQPCCKMQRFNLQNLFEMQVFLVFGVCFFSVWFGFGRICIVFTHH